jgi:glycosyltransferase involved in cell wall biosynthesis
VLHATTWAIPPRTAPLVVTIHDLAVLREPEPDGSPGDYALLRALDAVRDEADVVVVPSAATATDCIEHGIEPARIHVIPHGVRVPVVARAETLHFIESRGLDRPYVMWCGTFEARKNVTALLDAYALLLDEHRDLDLVLVGPAGWAGAPDEVARRMADMPPGRVHLLGRLAATDLHRAYAGARALCFPSTVEGFGLPVLEALAHGIPVVTSAATAMAEIGDSSAVLLVDPHSPEEIATALGAAATDRHAELAAGAAAIAGRFTWERSAEQHMVAYRAALTG